MGSGWKEVVAAILETLRVDRHHGGKFKRTSVCDTAG
jgi:hypothetical protein